MNHDAGRFDEIVSAYADGTLSPSERAVFEARLAADASIRQELDADRAMVEALRSAFEPPAGPGAMPVPPVAAGRAGSRRVWAGLAAALVLGVAGWWFVRSGAGPKGPPVPASAGAMYAAVVDAGFKPSWVCASDEEFALAVADRFGTSLIVSPTPGLEVIGWNYPAYRPVGYMTMSAMVLLARAEGREVLVLFDVPGSARRPVRDDERGLRVFEREVAGIALFEVTPLDEARVLPALREPAAEPLEPPDE